VGVRRLKVVDSFDIHDRSASTPKKIDETRDKPFVKFDIST